MKAKSYMRILCWNRLVGLFNIPFLVLVYSEHYSWVSQLEVSCSNTSKLRVHKDLSNY